MYNHINLLLFLLISTYSIPCFGEILKDANGKRFITVGSTKDEVLEILGTPKEINEGLNWWYYGYEHLSFDSSNRVKEFTDSEKLKVLLLPSSQTKKCNGTSPTSNRSVGCSSTTPTSSKPTSSSTSAISGYGEISEKTGRPKTVAVKGYTRKDGTYVKPHYRSAPKKK